MVVEYIQQGHTLRLCFFFSSGFNKVKGRTFESRRLKSIVLYRYKLPISTRNYPQPTVSLPSEWALSTNDQGIRAPHVLSRAKYRKIIT